MIEGKTLFKELGSHLLEDEKPSRYLTSIKDLPELREYPFNLLARLQDTPQSPLHHPEGNVWNHTLLVVDEAARVKGKSKNPDALMWAALLALCDRYGRTGANRCKEREGIRIFLECVGK